MLACTITAHLLIRVRLFAQINTQAQLKQIVILICESPWLDINLIAIFPTHFINIRLSRLIQNWLAQHWLDLFKTCWLPNVFFTFCIVLGPKIVFKARFLVFGNQSWWLLALLDLTLPMVEYFTPGSDSEVAIYLRIGKNVWLGIGENVEWRQFIFAWMNVDNVLHRFGLYYVQIFGTMLFVLI